jgi:predicted nucleic acid-binding protein
MGVILVDSSVWIDFLYQKQTFQTRTIRQLSAAKQRLAIGDLMMMEVLQGTRTQKAFDAALVLLEAFQPVAISDHRVAVDAARRYRHLRGLGITIRKTIVTLIATRCILDRLPLLYSDRDFDPFVQHLGLRSALVTPE